MVHGSRSNSAASEDASAGGGWFKTTHWTVVLTAGVNDTVVAKTALDRLCQTYWPPVYSFVRSRGYGKEDAEDLTQEFFARVLEKNWVAQADPNRGKFRSFLLGSINNFLANERRRGQAAKRGGARRVVPLDDTAEAQYEAVAASSSTPEKLFERRWAMSLFAAALSHLRAQYETSGRGAVFSLLQVFLSSDPGEGDYARAGNQLGMTEGAVAAAVHRLRQRYRELMREEIAQTLANPADFEDELRSLLESLN